MHTSLDLARYTDLSLLLLRLIVALVFISSGIGHLKEPRKRAESLGLGVSFTIFLGLAEVLGGIAIAIGFLTQLAAIGLSLIMLGAIFMKAIKWKTGFWGEKASGWHYDLLFLVMNIVILSTDGGRWTLTR